ncbi:MAG: holo-ACP synthase [Polyangiaceae bacterium]
MSDTFPTMNDRSSPAASANGDRAGLVVGLDLVQVRAIADSVAQFGDRFLERIYTSAELTYCLCDHANAPQRLAARFAAKEAVLKVLRRSDEPISWRSIEVAREPSGACSVLLFDEARALADAAGFVRFSLSMTHEADYAGAVVIGERASAS